MKILQLSRHLSSAGGVESYLRRLCAELAAGGHRVLALGGDAPGEGWPESAETRVVPGYHAFGAPGEKTDEVLRLAAEFSPDLIHLHEMDNYPLALALAERWPTVKHAHVDFTCAAGGPRFFRRARTACCRTVAPSCLWHYYAAPCGPGKNPFFALWSYRRSRSALAAWPRMRKLLVNSECLRKSCAAAGISGELMDVLHYFVPDAEESPREAGAGGRPEILFAGRLMPEKGLDDLVRALTLVKTDCRLVIVGAGPAQGSAEKLVRKLGLTGRAEFAGWQENMEPFYRRASLLCVPSLWPEPFGIVGIEAMARALPVVAYRSGGIPEWLDDGKTGILVEPGDIPGLAAALDEVLSDAEKARRMGRAGQSRQRELFGPARHIERLETIYKEIVGS